VWSGAFTDTRCAVPAIAGIPVASLDLAQGEHGEKHKACCRSIASLQMTVVLARCEQSRRKEQPYLVPARRAQVEDLRHMLERLTVQEMSVREVPSGI